jgi:hypothetical protein
VAIPPHLIFRIAEIRNDWFVIFDEHVVHAVRRFMPSRRPPLGKGAPDGNRGKSR